MSNYLAIATVTATLQRILQAAIQVDVAGARVTTVRPDSSGSGTPEVGVNLFLYQVSPNPAWRNADLRTRRPKGELIKQAQAGLDLHYLMTFHGNEVELEPQRLLGSAVRTLVDNPVLTPELIRDTITHSTFSFLEGSTLADQVERVILFPNLMNTEELSKIWSVFFQTTYVLSLAYQATAVLIEGEKSGKRGLPLLSRQIYVTPTQPIIEQVVSEAGANQPIVANSTLIIRGKQLRGNTPQVRLSDAKVTPQKVSDTEIRLELSSLPPEESRWLRAGVQGLQVLHRIQTQSQTRYEPERAVGSNVVPLTLCPTIIEIAVSDSLDNGYDLYLAEVTVQVDLIVGKEQRVVLVLNELLPEGSADNSVNRPSNGNPAAYIFAAKPREADTNSVVFPIRDVKEGEYLVRVQVDSAESLLSVESDRYSGPKVVIS